MENGLKRLQGEWRFDQPRDPVRELRYSEMILQISGDRFRIVKDGETADEGVIRADGWRYVSDHGKFYVFYDLNCSGMENGKLTAYYSEGEKTTLVDLCRIPGDPMTEFNRFLEDPVAEVDVVRSDADNRAAFQLEAKFGEDREGVPTCLLRRGREKSFRLTGDAVLSFRNDILKILLECRMGGFSSRCDFPGKEPLKNCLMLELRNTAEIRFCLKYRKEIPEEAENAARGICALFDRYCPAEEEKPESPSVVGTWIGEELFGSVPELHFEADGSYRSLGGPGRKPLPEEGHYVVREDSVFSADLVDRWDLYGNLNRWKTIGSYPSVRFCGDHLKVVPYHISDADSPVIRFAREGCAMPEKPAPMPSGGGFRMTAPDDNGLPLNLTGRPAAPKPAERKDQTGAKESVVCPECGNEVRKAKFCTECGNRLLCPECGGRITVKKAKFCTECGRKL